MKKKKISKKKKKRKGIPYSWTDHPNQKLSIDLIYYSVKFQCSSS